jgi:hypothetical protein
VIEIKRARKEKRARRLETRPKPTIYGNCDSWSFIVGKKPRAYSRTRGLTRALQRSNMEHIHNLSTGLGGKLWDNLWAICGSAVQHGSSSRIVVLPLFDMPLMADEVRRFYPKK